MISFNPDALDWFPLGGLSIPQSGYPQLSSVHNINGSGVTTLRVDKITTENSRTKSADKVQDKQCNNGKGIGNQYGNKYPPSPFDRMKVTRELPVLMPDIRNGPLQDHYYNNSQFPRSIFYNNGYIAPNLMYPGIYRQPLPFFPIHSMGFPSQTLHNHLVGRMHNKNIFRNVLQMPINPLGVLNPSTPNKQAAISTNDQRYATTQRPSLPSAIVFKPNDANIRDPGLQEDKSAGNERLPKQVRTSGTQQNNRIGETETNLFSKHNLNTHIPVDTTYTNHSACESTTMSYGKSSNDNVTTLGTSKIDVNNITFNHNTTTKMPKNNQKCSNKLNHVTTTEQHHKGNHYEPTENLIEQTRHVPIVSEATTIDEEQTHLSSKDKGSFLQKKLLTESSYKANGDVRKTILSNTAIDDCNPPSGKSTTNSNNIEFYMKPKISPDKIVVTKNNVRSSLNETGMSLKPSRNRYTEFLNGNSPINNSADGKIIHSDENFLYILFETKTSPPSVNVKVIPIDGYRKAICRKARPTNKDPASKIDNNADSDRIVKSIIVDEEPCRLVDDIRKENCTGNKRDQTVEKVIVGEKIIVRGEKNTGTIYHITSDSGDCLNSKDIQKNGFHRTNDEQNIYGNTCHSTLSTDSSPIPSVIGISSSSSFSSSFSSTLPSSTSSNIVSSTSFSSSSKSPSLLCATSHSLPTHPQPSSFKDNSAANQSHSFKSRKCKYDDMSTVTLPKEALQDIAPQICINKASIENGYTLYPAVKVSSCKNEEIAGETEIQTEDVDTRKSLKNIFLRKSSTSGDWEAFIKSEKVELDKKGSENESMGTSYLDEINENAKGGHSLRKRKLDVVKPTQITGKRVTHEEDTSPVIMDTFPKARSNGSRNLRSTYIRVLKGSLDEDVNVSTLSLEPRVILHDILCTYPQFSNDDYEE